MERLEGHLDPSTKVPAAAHVQRIIHLGLVAGLALMGATFVLLRRAGGGPLGAPPVGFVLTGIALAMLAVALTVLRGKVPARRFDQSADEYWGTNEVRGASIVLWAAIEAAGVLSSVGYLVSAQMAPAAVALLSLVALARLRPARLAGEGAA